MKEGRGTGLDEVMVGAATECVLQEGQVQTEGLGAPRVHAIGYEGQEVLRGAVARFRTAAGGDVSERVHREDALHATALPSPKSTVGTGAAPVKQVHPSESAPLCKTGSCTVMPVPPFKVHPSVRPGAAP